MTTDHFSNLVATNTSLPVAIILAGAIDHPSERVALFVTNFGARKGCANGNDPSLFRLSVKPREAFLHGLSGFQHGCYLFRRKSLFPIAIFLGVVGLLRPPGGSFRVHGGCRPRAPL